MIDICALLDQYLAMAREHCAGPVLPQEFADELGIPLVTFMQVQQFAVRLGIARVENGVLLLEL